LICMVKETGEDQDLALQVLTYGIRDRYTSIRKACNAWTYVWLYLTATLNPLFH
jgi:hypothetical protein